MPHPSLCGRRVGAPNGLGPPSFFQGQRPWEGHMSDFMPAVSGVDQERARKNQALILKHLAAVGQVRVAEAMQVHESTISKMKNGDLEQFTKLLGVLGIKCVPNYAKCVDPKWLNAIIMIAKERFARINSADDLEENWE